ncbi:MAG TPA: nuclear transport factor 2 family protein [Mucilaginibacter sp.]
MKPAAILIALVFSFTAVKAQTPKVIVDHFDALMAHNVKNIVAGYAKMFSPNWEGAKTGPEGINEVYSRYFASTPDMKFVITHVMVSNENVVAEYHVSGTLSNPEKGTPEYMKGKKYELDYCTVFTVFKGKITRETDYFDQLAFLRQVGFFDQK